MAPAFKLTYFDIRGIAEPIRYIFAQAGVEYEDVRIQAEKWPTLKSNFPFGKVPLLEIDGKLVPQSSSICRYLAKEFGLAGEDNWENLQIDSIVDTIVEIWCAIMDLLYAEEATKAQKKDKLLKETMPFVFSRLDKKVKENGGHFANNKLSWADLYFAAMYETFANLTEKDIFEKYPNLMALAEKIENLPNIKKWREKRPKN